MVLIDKPQYWNVAGEGLQQNTVIFFWIHCTNYKDVPSIGIDTSYLPHKLYKAGSLSFHNESGGVFKRTLIDSEFFSTEPFVHANSYLEALAVIPTNQPMPVLNYRHLRWQTHSINATMPSLLTSGVQTPLTWQGVIQEGNITGTMNATGQNFTNDTATLNMGGLTIKNNLEQTYLQPRLDKVGIWIPEGLIIEFDYQLFTIT